MKCLLDKKWSSDHLNGLIGTFGSSKTFTNELDVSLVEICRMQITIPCRRFYGFLDVWHEDLITYLESNKIVIQADYYEPLFDTAFHFEDPIYVECDYDEYGDDGIYKITDYNMKHAIVIIFYKSTNICVHD